jgi:hypothetical protein
MGEIISFDGARKQCRVQPARLQSQQNAGNRGGFNQFMQRVPVQMFLCGFTFREAAKKHPGREDGLARDIRAELLGKDAA